MEGTEGGPGKDLASSRLTGSSAMAILPARFRQPRPLGAGGMGMVFAARDAELGHEVAIKLLRQRRPGPKEMRRFRDEAEAARRVSHPNLVALLDHDLEADPPFLVFEYVAGVDLATRAHRGPGYGVREVLGWGIGIARGLAALHRAGLVHRDVKPGNVLVDHQGTARLCDLGLVLPLDEEYRRTTTGVMVGTPRFLAPEVWRGATASPASDQYSLAVTLVDLLVPRRGWPGAAVGELHRRALASERTPLPDLPGDPARVAPLREVLEIALDPDPDRRFPDADELADRLAGTQVSTPVAPPRSGPVSPSRSQAPRAVALSQSTMREGRGRGSPPSPRGTWILAPALAASVLAVMAASLVGKEPREPVPTVTPQASEDAVAAGGSWARLDALLEELSARHAPDLQGHRERKQHSLLQLELLTASGSEAAWEARLAAFEGWLRDPESAAPGARDRNLERVATRIGPILGHVLDDMLELHQEARVRATGLRFDNDLFLAPDQIEPVLSAWSTLQAMVEGVLDRAPIPDRPADDWRYAALSQLALPIRWGASARLAEVVPKLVDPRSPSAAPRPLFEAVQHLMLHRDLDLFVTCRARAAAVETLIDDLGLERGGKAPLDPDRVMRTLGLVMRSAMNCRDRREDLVHPQLLRVASLLEAPEAAGLRSALRGRAFDSWVAREEKFAAAFLESAPDTGILWKSLLRVVRGER